MKSGRRGSKMKTSTWYLLATGGIIASGVALYTFLRCPSVVGCTRKESSTHILKGGGVEVHVSAWGATITKLLVPDINGVKSDVVLGFDSLTPYQDGTSPYFGCIVGRVANRIANAQFTLSSRQYNLFANNGKNTLHGGKVGFDKVWWKAETFESEEGHQAVQLTYHSPDGEEGFPGNLKVKVTYRLATSGELAFGDTSLVTEMEATTDKPTPISLAQHTYWNLGGHSSGTILDHVLRLASEFYTPVDDALIPTGAVLATKGTDFDFQHPRPIEKGIYDHNFVLASHGKELPTGITPGPTIPVRLAATVFDPKSGRGMDLLTDAPGVQFYSGNFLDGSITGKDGARYVKNAGFCLETQGFPNAINTPSFPNVILRPGQTYKHTMVHRFYARP